MMHGPYYRRVRFLILLGSVFAGTLALGCSGSRYPKYVQYPPRSDLIVKKAETTDVSKLPPPGDLEKGIADASKMGKNGEKAALETTDPTRISKAERDELQDALLTLFGTPHSPSLEPSDNDTNSTELYTRAYGTAKQEAANITDDDVENLLLDRKTLAKGSELYRRHCLHCHGVAGDGRGPTAPWVHPHPRDYRQGTFKFISTAIVDAQGKIFSQRKPRRDDIYRTLEKGIDGTSMPAFGLMPKAELDLLVSYVIHLSIRGETEKEVLLKATPASSGSSDLVLSTSTEIKDAGGVKNFAYKQACATLMAWAASNKEKVNTPPAYPYDDNDKGAIAGSIQRGYDLFLGKGICITCHYDFGRQSPYRYDEWGTLVRPRNLTENVYRGGRRPLDLYWRLSGGISGSGMSALPQGLSEQNVWDLINFVQHLPYPAMLPDDVREKVYGKTPTRLAVAPGNHGQ